MSGKGSKKYLENIKRIQSGMIKANGHPMVAALPDFSFVFSGPALNLANDAWLSVSTEMRRAYGFNTNVKVYKPNYIVYPNIRRLATASEWTYILARMRLHIALNHLDPDRDDLPWHCACWVRAEEMVSVSGVENRPIDVPQPPIGLPRGSEQALAMHFTEHGIPPAVLALSLGGAGRPFWTFDGDSNLSEPVRSLHTKALALGIRNAATAAIEVAGGLRSALGTVKDGNSVVRQARQWMISEYPLLAALASSFTLIEDAQLCQNIGVEIAAISDSSQEIYFNPRVVFNLEEARFVMAHELLHAGLRHSARRQGRDPWLWNVACDYVINDWLIEMQLGVPPERIGYLHDIQLRGLSSEEIYDRIVTDLRWMRKLQKARAMNGSKPDIIDRDHSPGWWHGGGVELDAFYRRALAEGLELHLCRGRGYLPAGLVEEIRAQMQPPIPWDVKLAHWLDQYFPPLEKHRTFARAHRRQSATPDIARPAWVKPDEERAARVFGAVVDTSGSMGRSDLAKAIGTLASYAMSREVAFIRFVQRDAAPHDSGYVRPEELLDRVRIKGRGGTILMPGIRMLEEARDFPSDGPVLIITDGACDRLTVRRDHAVLLAPGCRMNHPVRCPVFHMSYMMDN